MVPGDLLDMGKINSELEIPTGTCGAPVWSRSSLVPFAKSTRVLYKKCKNRFTVFLPVQLHGACGALLRTSNQDYALCKV